ncbi:MAG: class I SAM-dependent DNA methyltransferase [Actinobacteria bacterium]|nr:class I SAM-dependent DNA methyltransferase [Actinomycetota bacterium]
MTTPTPDSLRADLAEFVLYRREYLTGDEKGEAQVFLDRLFQAFGHPGVAEVGAKLEMRIKKTDAKGTAFADLVWKPRCLVEMKKAGVDLSRHYRQAFDYWADLVPDRPRYVLLCNFDELWIYDFERQMDAPVDRIPLDDLPTRSEALGFMLPTPETPIFGNDLVAVTREAAGKVARVFLELHGRGIAREEAQRFVLQSIIAMFAEDVGLLPNKYFTRALTDSVSGDDAFDLLFNLFRQMDTAGVTAGGRYKGTPYFNGGIFAEVPAFNLTTSELDVLREAAFMDWSAVRPEIFGTLFEGSMAADERHAQGAHFTSQADIIKVVMPTIVRPWRERIQAARTQADLQKILGDMLSYRVLDPACGSGNFLYVAYREMRRLEHETSTLLAERTKRDSIQQTLGYVTPDHFYGIDRNPFAVEVAKVTMMMAKKLASDELGDDQEVLPLDNLDGSIVAADALFTQWPIAHAIIGNPPYLGRRRMVEGLGSGYTQRLAKEYPSIGGVSDFVCYWFPRTQDHLPPGGRAGYVATNSIRETSSRKVSLDYIVDHGGVIHDAVSSQPWSGDAVVHVSIVNWTKDTDIMPKVLWLKDGNLRLELPHIPASLSPDVDVARAKPLPVNRRPKVIHQGQTTGITKGYTLSPTEARALVAKDPGSAKVLHPFLGGIDLLHKLGPARWVIDIPHEDVLDAQLEAKGAFEHLRMFVLPERERLVKREAEQNAIGKASNPEFKPVSANLDSMETWWQQWRRRGDLIDQIAKLDRYIATSRHASENRLTVFTFVDPSIRPGDSMSLCTLDDDYSFGILSSGIHRSWFEARCSRLKADLRYTSTTVFDSFPWPQAPSTAEVQKIVATVKEILDLRAGHLAKGIDLARQYDALRQPGKSKLRDLHDKLDRNVLAAYNFDATDDILTQLLALNQDVAAHPEIARGPGAGGLTGTRVSDYRLMP